MNGEIHSRLGPGRWTVDIGQERTRDFQITVIEGQKRIEKSK